MVMFKTRFISMLVLLCLTVSGAWALSPQAGDTWDETTKTLTVNSDLPNQAYYDQGVIQHVIISNSVTSIGDEAFRYCSGLTSVKCVRETPANLGYNVFYGTHANLKIYVPAGSVDTYKAAWTAYADKIKAIPPAWVRAGDDWDEATKTLTVNSNPGTWAYMGRTVIQHVIISSGVTSIGFSAFTWCEGLTSVTIPNSVTSIGEGAFAACYALTSVTIPNSVTYIGDAAFFRCSGLTSVTCVRETPANLGNDVFRETHANFKIYVPEGSVNAYKGAKYWSAYAAKIKAIQPAPDWVRAGDLWDTDTKTLTVKSNLPEDAYKDQTVIEHVIINNDVTSIGNYAFNSCTNLSSVTFGNSVESIEWGAFAGCSGLTSVTIPNSVTSIGEGAFSGCTALTSIVVESGNSKYDSRENCNAIIEKSSNTLIAGCKNTIIPNSVTSIGDYTFFYCTALTSITIPNSVTSIGDYTFAVCTGLTSITIPNSVKSIGAGAFAACIGLTSIEIPNSVEYIGAEAFAVCTGLPSITIPNSVTSIGDYTFAVCTGLTSIEIPNSVTSIGEEAFAECSTLETVTIGNSVISIGNSAFSNCTGITSVTIPEGVTSIGSSAFAGCSGLTSVTINAQSLESYGTNAFQGTAEGLKIYVPAGSVNTYKTAWAAYADKIEAIVVEGVKIGDLYYNLKNDNKTAEVTSNPSKYSGGITIPATVTYNAQNYSVTSIGGSAFYDCTGLTSIEIPNSVTSIGEDAFAYCTGLTSVTIPNSVTSIGGSAFAYCSGLTSVTIPNSVTSIGYEAFRGCFGLTSIEIPNSVTSIGQSAFQSCSGLTSIEIPNSVTSIGMYAFDHCTALPSITIPNSVTSIGYGAFFGCTGLTSIEIPNGVTSIGTYAFSGCTALASFTINATTPPTLGTDAFAGTAEGLKIYVPAGSVNTYKAAENWSAYADKIEAIPATYTVTANLANGAYWATFYTEAGNYQAPEGTQVFAVNLDGTTITMIPVEDRIAKSGEGVVLKQATESSEPTTTITMTLDTETTPAGDFSANSLQGTMTSITNPGNAYVLNGKNGAGFYKLSSSGTIGANKAYLTYSGGGAAATRGFFLFDETTGIISVNGSGLMVNGSDGCYDLQGRRVLNPTKGLYIVNGKKVFINK